ncbi:odorant receptor 131-2-like [Gadus chalcogrammus]|uniref:odorant receptor 131-2-like n=1 Tax=Gadus chalcogrammus TaxID=1042646 RepID=UPI0024C4C66F|nr:odorant receptor 131-2-like [Gadus chalcogrammus]
MNVSGNNQEQESWYRDAFIKNLTVVLLGIVINYLNGSMVHTFHREEVLRENPRYVLFIHLVLNDMIQLFITISLFICTFVFLTINVSVCCLLMTAAVFTTQNTPLNLATMAVECYVAVCFPLRYATVCTLRRAHLAIGLMWATSALTVLPDLFILLATEPLSFFLSRVFCDRDRVFRSIYSVAKRDATNITLLVIVWLTLLYTYFSILFVARSASKDAKKAHNTVLLHGFQVLLCMMVYVQPMMLQGLIQLFPGSFSGLQFTAFVLTQILPRFVNPLLYGLRDKTFRRYLKKYILGRSRPCGRMKSFS